MSGAPIYVDVSVPEQADEDRAAFADQFEEATGAADDVHVIADEVRARYAATATALADRVNRTR